MGAICTCARAHGASVSQKRFDRLCSNLVCGLGVTKYVLSTSHGWGGASLHVRTCNPPPPSPYLRFRLNNFANIWCVVRDPIVTRFTKVGCGATAHSHVRLQFRCLGNRRVSALTLKPHQKQTYLFRSRSFIAKHGVLLVQDSQMIAQDLAIDIFPQIGGQSNIVSTRGHQRSKLRFFWKMFSWITSQLLTLGE